MCIHTRAHAHTHTFWLSQFLTKFAGMRFGICSRDGSTCEQVDAKMVLMARCVEQKKASPSVAVLGLKLDVINPGDTADFKGHIDEKLGPVNRTAFTGRLSSNGATFYHCFVWGHCWAPRTCTAKLMQYSERVPCGSVSLFTFASSLVKFWMKDQVTIHLME